MSIMIDVRPVLYILGWLTLCLAAMLSLPALVELVAQNRDWKAFAMAGAIAVFVGGILILSTRPEGRTRLNLRQAFLLTGLGWITVGLLGAIPFLDLGIDFTDAVFESVSGITTTGSTILSGLDSLPKGLLMWRAALQWVGGIGIIAIAVLLLPLLRVGGMQLFKIESSEKSQDVVLRPLKLIAALLGVYASLTFACATSYWIFGMSPFDAVAHSMATVSTGGYSTHDASFAYFKDYRLHWSATFFMISGALPFFLYIRSARGDFRFLFTDQQVKGLLSFLAIATVLLAWWLVNQRDIGFFEALTLTAFNITSIVTTTGFVSDDYTLWGSGAVGVFLILMFVGGCSGSTSGAIKIYRYQILYLIVRAHVKRLFSPNRITTLEYNGKTVPDDVPYSVLAFLSVFVATIALFTVVLAFLGLDIVTAYSASVTAITNVGPGLGTVIGPAGNFEPLPDAAKWVLSIAMLAGRLEVLALLVAFDREFWRF